MVNFQHFSKFKQCLQQLFSLKIIVLQIFIQVDELWGCFGCADLLFLRLHLFASLLMLLANRFHVPKQLPALTT